MMAVSSVTDGTQFLLQPGNMGHAAAAEEAFARGGICKGTFSCP